MSRVTEATREREIYKLASHLFENVPISVFGGPEGDRATPISRTLTSSDSSLTAFAQLGVHRLGASRCLISIFDRKSQYIVAEATPFSTIAPNCENSQGIWLGGTAVPRSWGICEHVLVATSDDEACRDDAAAGVGFLPVSVVPDLAEDSRFSNRSFIDKYPFNHFYAGVPIRTRRGINIGVYCVFGDKPRSGLDNGQIQFLQDMSWTIMGHLNATKASETYRRSDRMVRGIGSFVEGKSTMSRWWLGPTTRSFNDSGAEGALNTNQQVVEQNGSSVAPELNGLAHVRPQPAPIQHPKPGQTTLQRLTERPPEDSRSSFLQGSKTAAASATITFTASKPEEDMRLKQMKHVFGKAANILREAVEVEGVLFLDASVGSFGGLVPEHRDTGNMSDPLSDAGSSNESTFKSSQNEDDEVEDRLCGVFGFSTSSNSSIDKGLSSTSRLGLTEKFLTTLLRRYPLGRIFNFDEDGAVQSTDSEGENVIGSTDPHTQESARAGRKSRTRHTRDSEANIIISSFPKSRSVVLVPVWDSHKERWFAGAFVWTKTPTRVFTVEGELSFLRAFGMTIMAEIVRLDTLLAEKTRSDLLGSISHELRSPLHGIVAAVELLQDTTLDAFQGDLLHSMESCGRTLLDVIDHLLDYSKINKFTITSKQIAKASRHNQVTDRQKTFESKMTMLLSDIEIDALAEESVESIFTGHNFQKMSIAQLVRQSKSHHYDVDEMQRMDSIDAIEALRHHSGTFGARNFTLGAVSIYLDIDPSQNWMYHTQPGALRRIIINLLGNSLKYTNQGHIIVSLKQELPRRSHKHHNNLKILKITVSDTGKGIGTEFLHNHIFTPFAQENPLNPGTGLGLSLVQQIAKSLGGSIHIESHLGRGTSVCVTLPLSPSQVSSSLDSVFSDHVIALKGLRVSLLGMKNRIEMLGLASVSPPTELELMEALCRDWLQLDLVPADSTEVLPELIVCPDVSLDKVIERGSGRSLPPVVIICRSALAAHALRAEQQGAAPHEIFQYISQPAGPRKVAKAMVMALARWNDYKVSESWSLRSPLITGDVAVLSPPSTAATTPNGGRDEEVEPKFTTSPIQKPSDPESSETATPTSEQIVFTLPLLEQLPPNLETSSVSSSESQSSLSIVGTGHRHHTFLLVDDNRINLQILASFMKRLKLPYRTASNGREALDSYTASTGRFCCILMDISMPVMDGLEATRRIREFERKHKVTPAVILALTGLASSSAQQEAFASGIDIFMPKPVRLKGLAEVLGMDSTR